MIRPDCFGFSAVKNCCVVLNVKNCDNCAFYKPYSAFLDDLQSSHYKYLSRVNSASDHYHVKNVLIDDYDIIRLRKLGKKLNEISALSGYNVRQIQRILKKYK